MRHSLAMDGPSSIARRALLALVACLFTWFAIAPLAGMAREAEIRWGRPETLADHFARHGADFGARTPEEYVAAAVDLYRRARIEHLPTKVTRDGVLRIYDPRTNAFGAYNRDGSIRTLFKPDSPTYFDRQPGRYRPG